MEASKLLSGLEIVAHGATRLEASLPEIGQKEVISSGLWLELKQTQSALEARKHLVEKQRIEKCGVLSQAEWKEDLKLAEVTQKVGGHWQYIGHNVGRYLYLYPEEAIYLIETNCLLLRFNGIPVSLQQSYSLMLSANVTLIQYQVYASLSRLGYKLFRNNMSRTLCKKNNIITGLPLENNIDINEGINVEILNIASQYNSNVEESDQDNVNKINNVHKHLIELVETVNAKEDSNAEIDEKNKQKDEVAIDGTVNNKEECNVKTHETLKSKEDNMMELDESVNYRRNNRMETDNIIQSKEDNSIETDNIVSDEGHHKIETHEIVTSSTSSGTNITTKQNKNSSIQIGEMIIDDVTDTDKLSEIKRPKYRIFKNCNAKYLHKCFDTIPEFVQKDVVMVNVPAKKFVPESIVFSKDTFVLNLKKSKTNSNNSQAMNHTTETCDVRNGPNFPRLRSHSMDNIRQTRLNTQFPSNAGFIRLPLHNLWRPQNNINFLQLHLLFQQRSWFPNSLGPFPRIHFFPRSTPLFIHQNQFMAYNNEEPCVSRKRTRESGRRGHLESIKKLTQRIKHLYSLRKLENQNIFALQRLIQTYNVRYKTKLSLSADFNIVDNDVILKTIELDDDDENRNKKQKTSENNGNFDENLNKLRQFALKLKELDSKHVATARHRRAFSNAVKTFNKSYNADIYVNANSEVIDRRHIILASTSDSDCVIEETNKRLSKQLRNPFSVLKQSGTNQSINNRATSSTDISSGAKGTEMSVKKDHTYSHTLLNTFNKYWLPEQHDFGRAEVAQQSDMYNRVIDSKKEQFLYNFLRKQSNKYENWFEAKNAFFQNLEDTAVRLETEAFTKNNIEIKSIVKPEDCTDMHTILEKLRIIKCNKDVQYASNLKIDFDVYNKDVKNFRKTSPPAPHFRIICLSQSEGIPCGAEVARVQSICDDIPIVYAFVGIGTISYLQIKSTELPVNVASHDDVI